MAVNIIRITFNAYVSARILISNIFCFQFRTFLIQVLIADFVLAYIVDRACLWLFGGGRHQELWLERILYISLLNPKTRAQLNTQIRFLFVSQRIHWLSVLLFLYFYELYRYSVKHYFCKDWLIQWKVHYLNKRIRCVNRTALVIHFPSTVKANNTNSLWNKLMRKIKKEIYIYIYMYMSTLYACVNEYKYYYAKWNRGMSMWCEYVQIEVNNYYVISLYSCFKIPAYKWSQNDINSNTL